MSVNNSGRELFAVVAMTSEGVIGRDGGMPWHLPADMFRFKRLTLGRPCIMGRKVWDSLYVKPLSGRQNIVLTRNEQFQADGAVIVHSPGAALDAARNAPEVAIIGGAEIYGVYLPQLTRIELTVIHADIKGDTFFPELNADWEVKAEKFRPADEKNHYDLTFRTLQRRNA